MCEEHSEWNSFKNKLISSEGIVRRRMPKEWIQKIISEAAEMGVREIIPTTMGDPLVTNSFELIASLASAKKMKLNITHNGTFPGKSVRDWAKIIVPVTSDIKISWNGATASIAESIMKGLNFHQAVQNLTEFIQYRDWWQSKTGYHCRVTLQLTFMRNNMHEIQAIIKLSADLGVDRIKGHHLWVHYQELEHLSFKRDIATIEEWNKIVQEALKAADLYRRKDGQKVLLENFNLLSVNNLNEVPDDHECPFLGKELWISATGQISPCCAPDELRKSLGDFGNIRDMSLSDVIYSYEYQNLINNYKSNNLCKSCNMRRPKQEQHR
jgi:MoaA/NifB/PqqE/SkfB family radical SAM enzyme